jgi:hypothetical protein
MMLTGTGSKTVRCKHLFHFASPPVSLCVSLFREFHAKPLYKSKNVVFRVPTHVSERWYMKVYLELRESSFNHQYMRNEEF